jgi:hypothetical protein
MSTPAARLAYLKALAQFRGGRTPGRDQTAEQYRGSDSQEGYVGSYGLEYPALWWKIRALLGWSHGRNVPDLTSIGAGPYLDFVGWCWEEPWVGDKLAVDPLPWEAVRDDARWARAVRKLCGPIRVHAAFVPGPVVPLQLEGMSVGYLPPKHVPENSTVLLPYILNHLRAGNVHAPNDLGAQAGLLRRWLNRLVEKRGCRVVIADYDGKRMWQQLGLGGTYVPFRMTTADYEAFDLDDFGLPDVCRDRTVGVLVGDAGRWEFLENV